MRYFDDVKMAPLDPIFGLGQEFQKDSRNTKVNLSVGIYQNERGKVPVMKAVREAERKLLAEGGSKVYLPMEGDLEFREKTGALVFGELFSTYKDKIAIIQSLGGTGALRIGADFLYQHGMKNAHITKPTWPNHRGVFSKAGFTIHEIPYPDDVKLHVEKIGKGELIVYHASCHNPTGIDPTEKEWEQILTISRDKEQFCFFDAAYLGLGKGLAYDRYCLTYALENNMSFACSVSFSKNFSLYAERIGVLFVVCQDAEEKKRVESQLKSLARTMYSNPPCHGSDIVKTILKEEKLFSLWKEELEQMRTRLARVRDQFAHALQPKIPEKNFLAIKNGLGMFAFTGLNEAEVISLREKKGVYMTLDGRVNLAGLNEDNIHYVVESIHEIIP